MLNVTMSFDLSWTHLQMMHFEVKMNYANPQEHVHEAKHNNRAINE
jgi:hypothetical protein